MPGSTAEKITKIFLEFLDLEPKHREFTNKELMNITQEIALPEFLDSVYLTKRFDQISNLFYLTNVLQFSSFPKKNEHCAIFVPIGHALLVLAEGIDSFEDFQFNLHPNPGIRLLVAFNTNSKEILDQLSYDRCALVRAEVAKNKSTPNETLDRLAGKFMYSYDPFTYVRQNLVDISNSNAKEHTEDLVYNLDLSQCVCNHSDKNYDFEEFFENNNLEVPVITTFFERDITNFGNWNWATQPYPDRMQDYLFESIEYLKGPIPDQYSLNHAGHGINSYSLNLRCAIGNLAILAQVGWGGGYMDSSDQANRWDEIQQILSTFLLRHGDFNSTEIKLRKYLIIYSDFRLEEPELWVRAKSKWLKLEYIHDWDQILDYLNQHNQLDPDYKKMYGDKD